ncbi:MAG: glycosyltransferase [Bacteroidia bacterium]|nr:MAG: glycosyltransferase [Bacteroidia bacterium]
MQYQKDISIVIPQLNEAESLPELMEWIDRVVAREGWRAEVIYIDDGSTDDSWRVIAAMSPEHTQVRAIRFQRNYGKAAALQVGFMAARGRVVCTMDADLQDSPDELPEMYRMVLQEGYDLVSGWKKVRHDPKLAKNIPSKLFNFTARTVTGIKLHDFNCGIKAYRHEVVKAIELYGDMHRYIPALASNAGFRRIGEKVVQHRARKYGSTKFGWNRFVNGFLDLITLSFVSRFGKKPMHFFGFLGIFTFLIGGGIIVWLIVEKVRAIAKHLVYRNVTDQPLFFIALLLVVIGVMFFLTGFIGELIARAAPHRNRYGIAERID